MNLQEVQAAFASGAKIEYRYRGGFAWSITTEPSWSDHIEYRVWRERRHLSLVHQTEYGKQTTWMPCWSWVLADRITDPRPVERSAACTTIQSVPLSEPAACPSRSATCLAEEECQSASSTLPLRATGT